MFSEHLTYDERRAGDERPKAAEPSNARVAAIHQELAARHEERISLEASRAQQWPVRTRLVSVAEVCATQCWGTTPKPPLHVQSPTLCVRDGEVRWLVPGGPLLYWNCRPWQRTLTTGTANRDIIVTKPRASEGRP